MNKYYFDFFIEELKKDIIHDLMDQGIDGKIVQKEVNLYFEDEIQFDEIKISNTHQIRPRCAYQEKKDRCKARVWNEGEGGQCSCKGILNGFCKTHHNKGGDQWFLGTIDQPRPERPVHHNGKILTWN